jgi:phosphonopyruvate decarboxylase
MLTPEFFYEKLKSNGIDFYTGVPDSLLKDFCAYITDVSEKDNHITAVNEGCAVGIATGYHLATGKIPVVYMQNSGLGNATNPLLSLAAPEVYSIPMILVIGWRGEPGCKDEPQHVCQGKVTSALLDAMKIPYVVLEDGNYFMNKQISDLISNLKKSNSPVAILVRKDTFDKYPKTKKEMHSYLSREDAIKIIVDNLSEDDIVVSTTGMASRELFEYRQFKNQTNAHDFLTVGSMGHASQIALGIALNTEHKVICLDGDGAALMHMGGMATIGTSKSKNLVHIVLNNEAHDSVGGQPTVAGKINLAGIALACRYHEAWHVHTADELYGALTSDKTKGPIFIEVSISTGHRKDLGRPTSTPIENKESLMKYLNSK